MRDFLGEYGAIVSGLFIGSIAHFGRLVAEGKVPSIRQILGFFMQLGLVGLVAAVTTRRLGIDDSDVRALTTALLALSTNEVVQFIKKRSWRPFVDSIFHTMGYSRHDID